MGVWGQASAAIGRRDVTELKQLVGTVHPTAEQNFPPLRGVTLVAFFITDYFKILTLG